MPQRDEPGAAADGGGGRWRRLVDTNLPSPDDIVEQNAVPLNPGDHYTLTPRSTVILIA